MKTVVDLVTALKTYFLGKDKAAKQAVESNIAPVEVDASSSAADYSVGDQLILNDILYDVTASISINDALVVGTNIDVADNIVTQIKSGITLDNVPTKNSNNGVKSGGVYDADANIYAVIGKNGAKNLIPFDLAAIKALNINGTWTDNVYNYRGVDFTVYNDGTVLADGQATGGNASLKMFEGTEDSPLIGRNLILSGSPSGGSATTYRQQAYRVGSADGSSGTFFDDGDGSTAFTYLNNASGTKASVAIAIYENYDADNLLFKPMLRDSADTDTTYQPPCKTNQQLTAENQILETALLDKLGTSDIANNLTTTTPGKVLDATQGKALNDSISTTNKAITNKHKVKSIKVTTSGWTSDTTSQSGTTLYKKSISLSHVYVDSPSIDIGSASGSALPTTAQQTAYDLLQYVTVDGTTMYLYGSDIPTVAYYINVEGVD